MGYIYNPWCLADIGNFFHLPNMNIDGSLSKPSEIIELHRIQVMAAEKSPQTIERMGDAVEQP